MNSVQVQIQQHLSQPVRVSLNTLKRLIRREPQLNLSALGILTDQIQGVSNNIIEVNRLERQMRGLYQFEQFAYHPVQTVGLFGHHLRQFMRLATGWRALGKVFRQPFDGRAGYEFRARRPPPDAPSPPAFLYASLHQAVLCVSADNADAKKRQ